MNVALTGATGFIGSHVLAELQGHGHEVTALVRNDGDAETVSARGATPAVVDLYDRPAVVGLFSDADGAIHTASPGDETSADLDSAVVDSAETVTSATTRTSQFVIPVGSGTPGRARIPCPSATPFRNDHPQRPVLPPARPPEEPRPCPAPAPA